MSTPYVRQLKKWSGDTNPYFIHSDRADYLKNMKELVCVQWLKVKTRRLRCACIGARWFIWSTKGVGLYTQRLKFYTDKKLEILDFCLSYTFWIRPHDEWVRLMCDKRRSKGEDIGIRQAKMPCMSRTSYPPTDYTAVLSAMRGLTTEFGMGSGDPSLYGSAHTRHSPYMNLIYEVIRLRVLRTLKVT